MSQLQNTGTMLFDQFFPEDMQAYLWEHRDLVHDLIVYTDEPFVPWELVHLKPARGKRGTTPRFLASGGLVRWQLGSFPPQHVRVRRGHARSICPVYANPMFKNDVGAAEAGYLRDRFGAKAVTATPTGVERLLRGGRFRPAPLLRPRGGTFRRHRRGEGAAQGRSGAARTVREQYLSATDVAENLDWTGPDQRRPARRPQRLPDRALRRAASRRSVASPRRSSTPAPRRSSRACGRCRRSRPGSSSRRSTRSCSTGTPMSRASALARAAARDADDPTWLAYVVYARPDAVLEPV